MKKSEGDKLSEDRMMSLMNPMSPTQKEWRIKRLWKLILSFWIIRSINKPQKTKNKKKRKMRFHSIINTK